MACLGRAGWSPDPGTGHSNPYSEVLGVDTLTHTCTHTITGGDGKGPRPEYRTMNYK